MARALKQRAGPPAPRIRAAPARAARAPTRVRPAREFSLQSTCVCGSQCTNCHRRDERREARAHFGTYAHVHMLHVSCASCFAALLLPWSDPATPKDPRIKRASRSTIPFARYAHHPDSTTTRSHPARGYTAHHNTRDCITPTHVCSCDRANFAFRFALWIAYQVAF